MKKLLREFKDFAVKGNVVDMAVGVMIGGAFGKIVTSVVNDLFMPVLSLLTGGINTSALFLPLGPGTFQTIEEAQAAGVATFNYGNFLQTVIDFVLIALCIFLFVKLVAKLRKPAAPAPAPPVQTAPFRCPISKPSCAAPSARKHRASTVSRRSADAPASRRSRTRMCWKTNST